MPRDAPGALRVLVPMKPLDDAKSRLRAAVPSMELRAAVLSMLDRVVRAASDALGPGACVVFGGDGLVRAVVAEGGGRWEPDPGNTLNASLWRAMQDAYADGADATLFLPADLPMIEGADVLELARASDGYTRPVGVEATADGGTNALLVPAAQAFAPRLGEDSFAKHREAADAQGTPLVALDAPRLAFDVDSVEDYAWAKAEVGGFASSIDRWQAWLQAASANSPAGARPSP